MEASFFVIGIVVGMIFPVSLFIGIKLGQWIADRFWKTGGLLW